MDECEDWNASGAGAPLVLLGCEHRLVPKFRVVANRAQDDEEEICESCIEWFLDMCERALIGREQLGGTAT